MKRFGKGLVLGGTWWILVSLFVAPAERVAQAEQPMGARMCASEKEVREQLAEKYKEAPVAFGLQSNGNLLQIYASEGKAWTAVSVRPDGVSCVVATGDHWETLDPNTDPMA